MNDSITTAVRHDLQALVHDLGMHLSSVQGGTVAHTQEVAADYLIQLMNVQDSDDTVTARMLRDVQAHAKKRGES